jgi:hypothetical protein
MDGECVEKRVRARRAEGEKRERDWIHGLNSKRKSATSGTWNEKHIACIPLMFPSKVLYVVHGIS